MYQIIRSIVGYDSFHMLLQFPLDTQTDESANINAWQEINVRLIHRFDFWGPRTVWCQWLRLSLAIKNQADEMRAKAKKILVPLERTQTEYNSRWPEFNAFLLPINSLCLSLSSSFIRSVCVYKAVFIIFYLIYISERTWDNTSKTNNRWNTGGNGHKHRLGVLFHDFLPFNGQSLFLSLVC